MSGSVRHDQPGDSQRGHGKGRDGRTFSGTTLNATGPSSGIRALTEKPPVARLARLRLRVEKPEHDRLNRPWIRIMEMSRTLAVIYEIER